MRERTAMAAAADSQIGGSSDEPAKSGQQFSTQCHHGTTRPTQQKQLFTIIDRESPFMPLHSDDTESDLNERPKRIYFPKEYPPSRVHHHHSTASS